MAWRSEKSRVVSPGRVSSWGLSAGPHLNSVWPIQIQFSQYNLSVICAHMFSILGNTHVLLDCCLLFIVLFPSGPFVRKMLEKLFFPYALTFLSFYQFNTLTLNSKKIPSFHFPAHWLSILYLHYLLHFCFVKIFKFSSPSMIQVPLRLYPLYTFWDVHFNSVPQSCLTHCDPMDCNMPHFPVHHQLPEVAQPHVNRVGEAIPLSHPLLSPSSPALNLSQHQNLFKWVSSSHQVAKILEL